MKLKLYKIQNKETGLFSKGGTSTWANSIWTKGGKTWTNIGHVQNHLNCFLEPNGEQKKDYPYHNAEIVVAEINYAADDLLRINIDDFVKEVQLEKAEQVERENERYEVWQKEQDLKKLAELRAKYPNE